MSHVRAGARAKRIRQAAADARLEKSQAFMAEANRLLAEAGVEERIADVIVDITPDQVRQIREQCMDLAVSAVKAGEL